MLGLFVLLVALAAVNGGALYDSADRIINGEDANEGEFPFMLSLRLIKRNHSHSCGATILTKNWALTAGHCFINRCSDDLLVKAGTIYIDRGGTNHTIEKIIRHERFGQDAYNGNDIAVMRVKDPFTFDKYVQPVTLPKKDFLVSPGDKLTAAGWGDTRPPKMTSENATEPNRLQKADTFIAVSNEECGKAFKKRMYPGFLCARGGKEGQSACFGDSGGPLLKSGVQVGIVSWGHPNCNYTYPTVYARVSHFIDWIVDNLGPDAADLKFSE